MRAELHFVRYIAKTLKNNNILCSRWEFSEEKITVKMPRLFLYADQCVVDMRCNTGHGRCVSDIFLETLSFFLFSFWCAHKPITRCLPSIFHTYSPFFVLAFHSGFPNCVYTFQFCSPLSSSHLLFVLSVSTLSHKVNSVNRSMDGGCAWVNPPKFHRNRMTGIKTPPWSPTMSFIPPHNHLRPRVLNPNHKPSQVRRLKLESVSS